MSLTNRILGVFKKVLFHLPSGVGILLAAFPASGNYRLRDYSFNSGGVSNSTSSNYALNGAAGEVAGGGETGTTYNMGPGLLFTQQANVPPAPTLDNGSGVYYSKLHIVINTAANPTDSKFLVALSTDNFATSYFVQADGTLNATYQAGDYQNYTQWGATGGSFIVGLQPSTAYKVHIKAVQGKFTETQYGPSTAVSTATPSIGFGVTTTTQGSPPFSINYGQLIPNTVTDSPQQINLSYSTNGVMGGTIFVKDKNTGLQSATAGYTIGSVTRDLASVGALEGFGVQVVSAVQTSGGPLVASTPYSSSGQNVGSVGAAYSQLFTAAAPITGGAGALILKVKTSSITPAAADYSDVITLIGVANF